MKKSPLLLTVIGLLFASYVSAQTADEVIAKYLQAIGGKDKIKCHHFPVYRRQHGSYGYDRSYQVDDP